MPKKRTSTKPSPTLKHNILYEIVGTDTNSHTFKVKCTLSKPTKNQVIHFPQWIVGSYMIRDFSKQLHDLTAEQNNKPVLCHQLTKSSWALGCTSKSALTLTYDVYARDVSVRGAWLDAERAFFNGTSLFFEFEGHSDQPCLLNLNSNSFKDLENPLNSEPKVLTGLEPLKTDKNGWGVYAAQSYSALVDTPVLIGNPWVGEFSTRGVLHRFAVTGCPPSFDTERLLTDCKKICETIIDFWHQGAEPAVDAYLFILNATQDGYGGLEHHNSTVLQCKRTDLPNVHKGHSSDGYAGLLGLISHEYFHTWNVKRLRPLEFTRYQFDRENYTEMLWFFEGFTSYFDDLLLRRSGLITDQQYLKLVNKNIQQVLQTPGRRVQSVAKASFDAWVKYYKSDENTPNITVSYYAKGALIALCFDLKLRSFNSSLDSVMRELFNRSKGGPMGQSDFEQVLADLTHRSWKKEITQWVHGIKDLPYETLLGENGVQVDKAPDPLQLQLGIRADEVKSGIHIKMVLSGSIAQASGFAPGDEWIGIEIGEQLSSVKIKKSQKSNKTPTSYTSSWRLKKLDDLALFIGKRKDFNALVCRDQRIIKLHVDFDIDSVSENRSNCTLSVKDKERLSKWLLNI